MPRPMYGNSGILVALHPPVRILDTVCLLVLEELGMF